MSESTEIEVSRICIKCKRVVTKKVELKPGMSPASIEDFKRYQSRDTLRYTICGDCAVMPTNKRRLY